MLDKRWPLKSKNPKRIGIEFSLCGWPNIQTEESSTRLTETLNQSAEGLWNREETSSKKKKKNSSSSSLLICHRKSEKVVFSSAFLHLNIFFSHTHIYEHTHKQTVLSGSAESFSLHARLSPFEDPLLTVVCFWLVILMWWRCSTVWVGYLKVCVQCTCVSTRGNVWLCRLAGFTSPFFQFLPQKFPRLHQ